MHLHFRVQGDGPPLILLHGFLGSLENWQAMSKRFAQQFKVYSLDLRNHGRSPHSELMSYPVMAEDVRELIVGQNLTAPFVLGHSMGGKVAMQLALEHPDALEKLVIADIAPKAYPPDHRPMLLAMRAIDVDAYSSFGEVADALSGAIPDPAIRQFILKNLARDNSGKFHWRLGLDEIIQNYDALTGAIVAEKRFTKPVCFIRAGRSAFLQDRDLPAIRKIFPNAEVKLLANAGHWVHIDAADEFQTMVTSFLRAKANL